MKKIIHYLTDEEKEVFYSFFLNKNKLSIKKDFLATRSLILQMYQLDSMTKNDVSIELMWDKNANQSHVLYFLKNNFLPLSGNKIKDFLFFNPDLRFKSSNGEAPLSILLSGNYFVWINEFMKETLGKSNQIGFKDLDGDDMLSLFNGSAIKKVRSLAESIIGKGDDFLMTREHLTFRSVVNNSFVFLDLFLEKRNCEERQAIAFFDEVRNVFYSLEKGLSKASPSEKQLNNFNKAL